MPRILLFFLGFLLTACQPSPPPDGIIALTPSLSEAVLSFKNTKLISVSPFDENPQATDLPRIGNAGAIERITAMRPELVLLHPSEIQNAAKLNAMGIKTRLYSMETIDEIEFALIDLGTLLHQEKTAQTTIAQMHQSLNENASAYKTDHPQTILIIIDRLDARMQQLYLAQADAYLVDLVKGCGYEVISLSNNRWERIESERLIQLNPDAILFLAHGPEDAIEVKKQFEQLYPTLNAIQNRRLFVYGNASISVPGPQMGKRQTDLCIFLDLNDERVD